MSVAVEPRRKQGNQAEKWKPNIYFSPDVAGSGVGELSFYYLLDHVKEALMDAERVINRGFPSMEEVKKILEEKVMEKLNQYQNIEYVEYYFDEGAVWDEIEVGNTVVSRTYDAIDWLTVAIADGPEILFDVHADYVVAEEGNKRRVVYFKINSIKLNVTRF